MWVAQCFPPPFSKGKWVRLLVFFPFSKKVSNWSKFDTQYGTLIDCALSVLVFI